MTGRIAKTLKGLGERSERVQQKASRKQRNPAVSYSLHTAREGDVDSGRGEWGLTMIMERRVEVSKVREWKIGPRQETKSKPEQEPWRASKTSGARNRNLKGYPVIQ
jgi:hypothetical protein